MSNGDIWQCGCDHGKLALRLDGVVVCEACGSVAVLIERCLEPGGIDAGAMAEDAHRQRHVALHVALDELLADFIRHTSEPPLQRPIIDLIQWNYGQTLSPTEKE